VRLRISSTSASCAKKKLGTGCADGARGNLGVSRLLSGGTLSLRRFGRRRTSEEQGLPKPMNGPSLGSGQIGARLERATGRQDDQRMPPSSQRRPGAAAESGIAFGAVVTST